MHARKVKRGSAQLCGDREKIDTNRSVNDALPMLESIPLIFRIIAATIALGATVIGFFAAFQKYKTWKKRRILVDNEYSGKFLGQFNQKEIDSFISGYVIPKCAPADPTNKEGEEFLADIQESIFDYMDRNISSVQRSYNLILADTGMGKTMFCLNYLTHAIKRFPDLNFCLVSLSSRSAESQISSVANKSETVLIADAFDEDPQGFGRGRDRLSDILQKSADFKSVIVTCRSQYFISDDAIPRETPLPVLIPRQLGQSPTFSLIRSYIAPFSKKEIDRYLRKHFPFWQFWKWHARRQADALIASVPDLVHRPMLLERLPELARTPTKSNELYELYDLLVEGWLFRESRWIKFEHLRHISLELALTMYKQLDSRRGRIRPEEVIHLADRLFGESPDWTHLHARSLLNRDSQGNFKFAHKSIMEFLVVKGAVEGNDECVNVSWTAFMKELFISWGHSDSGEERWDRARSILESNEGRKNIAPLFDMHGTTAIRGVPDFKRAFERRYTSTGDRFAPPSWRQSSIYVNPVTESEQYSIVDHEFNLEWIYIPNRAGSDLPQLTLLDVLHFDLNDRSYKLPSLEQFLTLAEGLHRVDSDILTDGSLFLLEDKPGRHLHLLVQLNADPLINPALKIVDRCRLLSGTNIYVNSYLTGAPYATDYAKNVFVDQLKIHYKPSTLL